MKRYVILIIVLSISVLSSCIPSANNPQSLLEDFVAGAANSVNCDAEFQLKPEEGVVSFVREGGATNISISLGSTEEIVSPDVSFDKVVNGVNIYTRTVAASDNVQTVVTAGTGVSAIATYNSSAQESRQVCIAEN